MTPPGKRPIPINYADWKLVVSASQLETFELCPRKWWNKSVNKLPEIESKSQVFGNVMHACIERHLQADDLGRMPDGTPVDSFPTGWDVDLSPLEADLIKRLFQLGIEEGLVERLAGRKIEEPFAVPITSDVAITGYIDVLAPLHVQDHKTTKDRKWVKSRDDLRRNGQMMIYAAIAMSREIAEGRLAEAEAASAAVTLRHNAYVKDHKKPRAIKVENEVTGLEIERYWNEELLPKVEQMLCILDQDATPEAWREIQGPVDENEACNAFGGCPYKTICFGAESPSEYRKRVNSINAGTYSVPAITIEATSHTGTEPMPNIFEKLKAAAAGSAKPAAAPAPVAEPLRPLAPGTVTPAVPPPTAAPVPAPTTGLPTFTLPDDEQAAPWARAQCSACKGTGLHRMKGTPCIVCAGQARKDNVNPPELYDVVVDGGIATWSLKIDPNQNGSVRLAVGALKVEQRTEAPTPLAPPQPMPVTATATSAAPVERSKAAAVPRVLKPATPPGSVEVPVDTDDRGPGRPRRGFTLYIDCALVRGPKDNSISLTALLAQTIGPELATALGKGSYYEIPFYERRDMVSSKAAQIAELLGSQDVFVTSSDQDAMCLCTALETHAMRVVRALR